MRINKTLVDSAPTPEQSQAFYRDDLLKGFALRVTPKGVKSFVVEVRVGGKVRRKTLGRYGRLTVEQARKLAQRYLGEVASGHDPAAEQRAEQARQVTLGEAFEAYLRVRKGLKPRTVQDYRDLMAKSLGDWQDRPLASISKDAVAKRHERLGGKSHARANNAMRVLRAVFNFARHQYEDADGHSLFPENPVARLSHTRAWYHVGRRRTVLRATASCRRGSPPWKPCAGLRAISTTGRWPISSSCSCSPACAAVKASGCGGRRLTCRPVP